jgi:hypothetical protein
MTNTNGMNWLRQDKRLAIYLRDGLACVWCGDSVENGAKFHADHFIPDSKGGGNEESNIVTACQRCNCSRGNRSASKFAAGVAAYLNHGVTGAEILAHVNACRRRPLAEFRKQAKALIALRGSAAKVLADRRNVK